MPLIMKLQNLQFFYISYFCAFFNINEGTHKVIPSLPEMFCFCILFDHRHKVSFQGRKLKFRKKKILSKIRFGKILRKHLIKLLFLGLIWTKWEIFDQRVFRKF